ncbi:hypothetical protein Q6A77_03210 [Aliarcobacter skirrowii]|uniref:hypothetical protein n=1 Tax=Aliarcobacter skirrowii TaxID=28200 RepID=UPI0029B6F30B|nr:hypothetical protein [Aliarcobacter skirrowii]MDX4057668.1 hypothetical protein [Aliarcobacter skirrowii]
MVPDLLWKDEVLYQSKKLIKVYKDELEYLDMYEYAKNCKEEKNDGAIGGKDEEETKKHFSERFLTSSARVQFVVLDPKKHFLEISKDLKSTFSSGRISILDIPCGTGAGILSLLSNLAELRQFSKVPRLPIFIDILGGDYSKSALNIYVKLLNNIKLELENELIYINYDIFEWNASDMVSTNFLTSKWLKDEDKYEEFYILMSAFSGVGSSNYKRFEESFKFIQNRICHKPSTIIFIEPNTKESNIFMKLLEKTYTVLSWLMGKEESTNGDRFNWYDEIRNNTAKSEVLVKQYSRK